MADGVNANGHRSVSTHEGFFVNQRRGALRCGRILGQRGGGEAGGQRGQGQQDGKYGNAHQQLLHFEQLPLAVDVLLHELVHLVVGQMTTIARVQIAQLLLRFIEESFAVHVVLPGDDGQPRVRPPSSVSSGTMMLLVNLLVRWRQHDPGVVEIIIPGVAWLIHR